MLIALVLSIVLGVSGIMVLWFELSITKDEVFFMEETIFELNKRLTKLEKDAVKITFNSPFTTSGDTPNYYPDPQKKSNPKQFNGIVSQEPFVKTRKRKSKTSKD